MLFTTYQRPMDCIVVRLPRATRRTADGERDAIVALWVACPVAWNNARMRQIILYINAVVRLPREARRTADGVPTECESGMGCRRRPGS
jgi:hypothetical protein